MDMDFEEVSIYELINTMYTEQPKTPYTFQDAHHAGSDSVVYYFFVEDMPAYELEMLVVEVAECLSTMLAEEELPSHLPEIVAEWPHYVYADALVQRVCLLINEGVWSYDDTYALGMRLAKEGTDPMTVALGMLVLGAFENDVTASVLRLLGMHSEFTLYAILATQHWERANRMVYALAKNTIGYGKFAAIRFFVPLTQDQKEWMFTQGAVNCVIQNASAIACFAHADMQAYFKSVKVSRGNFSAFSYNLAYALENDTLTSGLIEERLIREYVAVAAEMASEFIDFAALVSLKQSASKSGEAYESEVYSICHTLINQKKWKHILLSELAQPSQSTSLVIAALVEYEKEAMYKKTFSLSISDFAPLLEQGDPYHLDVMHYLLLDKQDPQWQEIFHIFAHQLPEGILQGGPQVIDEEDLTPDFKPDVWLVYLLKAMSCFGQTMEESMLRKAESFYILCLQARFQEVRKEAVTALRSIKPWWSSHTEETLKNHIDAEPDENIKKRIRRLIGLKTQSKKEQRYVDISHVMVRPEPTDIFLLDTTIAGAFYRDMSVVEGQIAFGDVLFLKPEPENAYDSHAILITADDGYVLGYVPREENQALGERIKQGEKLYAKLCDELEYYGGRPYIEIWLSLEIEKEGNIVPFPIPYI